MVGVAHWIGAYVAVQGGVHELSRVRDRPPHLACFSLLSSTIICWRAVFGELGIK